MTKKGTLLVVDDNHAILTAVKMLAEDCFRVVATIASPAQLPARLRELKPDVVLLDMNFRSGMNTGGEGLFWLGETKRLSPDTEVVLFTAYADIDLAVKGIKEGAADFVVKPFDNSRLLHILCAARDKNDKPATRSRTQDASAADGMMWGESEAMTRLRQMVEKVAATDADILITGENGTGKEMLAREIHRLSHRAKGPMVPIDMGAVSESLFESELFGHVKGAFTDAKADKPGKFETAAGGTLFLDEIGNLSYQLQAKLLTALQRRQIVRVGGTTPIDINVRLVCATNRDLDRMVADGLFREDLLYRINTIRLHLPPLRERRTDIVPLAQMFLARYAALYGKPETRLSSEAERYIASLPWSGNIRELQHAMERAVILADGCVVRPDDIACAPSHAPSASTAAVTSLPGAAPQTLDDMERQMISQALADCGGNMSAVAARLGISRQTLYNKIKRYGL